MKSSRGMVCLAWVISMLSLMGLWSSAYGEGKFSVYMFGDFYYNISNNNSNLKGQNGFWFRRIYFTYDYKITDEWSTRFRLELNSPGDFKTKDTIKPFVKDAYVQWKKKTQKIILGISPTPTWEFIESFWGYRSVEKTPLDLYKMGDSRDFGIALKGSTGKDAVFGYHLMAANGEGTKSELNKEKKFMGAFLFNLIKAFSLELYADYAQGSNHTNYHTYQGFFGWKSKKVRIGLQYSHQTREQGIGKGDLKLDIYSIFGISNLAEKVSLLARYDRVGNSLPWGSKVSYVPFNNDAPFNLILFGVDFHPLKNVSFIPNIMYVSYKNVNGKAIDEDIQLKLTFFYSF